MQIKKNIYIFLSLFFIFGFFSGKIYENKVQNRLNKELSINFPKYLLYKTSKTNIFEYKINLGIIGQADKYSEKYYYILNYIPYLIKKIPSKLHQENFFKINSQFTFTATNKFSKVHTIITNIDDKGNVRIDKITDFNIREGLTVLVIEKFIYNFESDNSKETILSYYEKILKNEGWKYQKTINNQIYYDSKRKEYPHSKIILDFNNNENYRIIFRIYFGSNK